jgi:aminomethyltransferase
MSATIEQNSELKRTPLFNAHVAAGGKMVPFGGWEMPLHYGSQLAEHKATRTACGLFDVSHMGQIEITGPAALRLVQEIVTRDISALKDGEEAYTAMCRENGGIIDDLIVTRFGPEEFFIVVNAGPYEKDMAFMREVAARLALPQVVLNPCAEDWAMIAVQGPSYADVLAKVIGEGDWRQLHSYRARKMDYRGTEMILSTTGYTGEPGVELICVPDVAERLWNELVAAGGIPCGLAARDTLRLEKGMNLSGQDFTEENNPFEARLAWVVNLKKESFSGREALARIKAEGPKRKLVGLLPEGRRIPRHEAKILASGNEVGFITSGGFSPSLDRPIAMGYLRSDLAKVGTSLEIDLGKGQTAKAVVSDLPFYPAKKE